MLHLEIPLQAIIKVLMIDVKVRGVELAMEIAIKSDLVRGVTIRDLKEAQVLRIIIIIEKIVTQEKIVTYWVVIRKKPMLVIQVVMLHRRNSWRILLGLISIVIMVDIHRNNNLKKLSLKKEYIQINSIQTSTVHQIIFIKAIVNPHKPQSLTVHNLLQYPICLISTLPHLRIYIQIAIQVTLNKLKQITRKKENPLLSKIIL